MALMQLGDYVAIRVFLLAGHIVWSFGVISCVYFCFVQLRFLIEERKIISVQRLNPAFHVASVGIVSAAATNFGLVHQLVLVSRILFWFGLNSFLILLPPLSYSALLRKPFPSVGSYGVLQATAPLCNVGFHNSGFAGIQEHAMQLWMDYVLLALTYIGLLILLVKSPMVFFTLWHIPNPSLSGLTFPIIIFTDAKGRLPFPRSIILNGLNR
jgi:hypothetical protein